MKDQILVKCDCECHNPDVQMMHIVACCHGGMAPLSTWNVQNISICGLSIMVDYKDGKSKVYLYDNDEQMEECFYKSFKTI